MFDIPQSEAVRRQRLRVHHPAEGNQFRQRIALILAQRLTPHFTQRTTPEEREPELLLQPWFHGRADVLARRGEVSPV